MTVRHAESYLVLDVSAAVGFDESLIVVAILGWNVCRDFVDLNAGLDLALL